MTDLIHCIYASAARAGLGDTDLADLLRLAREKNQRLGLTGMLLYVQGSFFQVLEGPPDVVDALYDQIAADTRHDRVTRIIREPIPKRHFGVWTMGYSRLTQADLAGLAGTNDFFHGGSSLDRIDAGRAKKLLTAFQKGRWRMALAGAREAA
ncbi:MAG: BLUF domain-containing protein [Lautropia sp.]